MAAEITSTSEIAEREWDGHSEPGDVRTDMVATKTAEGKGIEFHVSMRNYTMHDMDDLIIEAAAALIVGKRSDKEMTKQIEAKCLELVVAKANEALQKVTAEIIDQPITTTFGDKKPMTMREIIGLTGREYLTMPVDSYGRARGEKDFDDYRRGTTPRMAYLISQMMYGKFKEEIEKATDAAVREIRAELKKQHEAVIAAEMVRFREALAKATGAA